MKASLKRAGTTDTCSPSVMGADPGGCMDGYGHILEYPQARIGAFAEEHGFLDLSRTNERPNVGEARRRSTATSQISPTTTRTSFPCGWRTW